MTDFRPSASVLRSRFSITRFPRRQWWAPLANAHLRSLEWKDHNGSVWLLTGHARRVGLEFGSSDEDGKLILPTLPQGALVKFQITHPDFTGYPEDLIPFERPDYAEANKTLLLGQPAPEFDCVTWLNGEKDSYRLSDFHGKYVLVDRVLSASVYDSF